MISQYKYLWTFPLLTNKSVKLFDLFTLSSNVSFPLSSIHFWKSVRGELYNLKLIGRVC